MMKKQNIFTVLSENLRHNRKELLRLWLIVLGIHLISLSFGFAIFLIIFGVQLILRKIIVIWLPARKWFTKKFSITVDELDKSYIPSGRDTALSRFSFFNALAHVVVGLYLIAIGFGIILRDGFLKQNIIYLIFINS